MGAIDDIDIEITVELGAAKMPIHHLLRLGRGAVIELEATQYDPMKIYANNTLVAHGEIKIDDGQLTVEVTDRVRKQA